MFRGLYVAIATPFRDGAVDFSTLDRLIEFHVENGTHGIVPCGTTGESATLSHQEHDLVIGRVVERSRGRVKVLAGTGSNNTAEAIRLTRAAQDAGADGALLITPYYNKPTQRGLVEHYAAVAEATSIPLILYNVPGRTQVNMLPATVIECAALPNVVGIKEASGSIDQCVEILRGCDLDVISGDDSLTLPMMLMGACGVISVAANVAPRAVADMVKHALAEEWQAARELHMRLFPLFTGLFMETSPIPLKAAMALMGLAGAELRLPMTPLQEKNLPALKQLLTEQGLL